MSKLQGNLRFWKEFIDDYNSGKQYSLECTESEIQGRVFRRIAGLNILIIQELLSSGTAPFDDALRHWNAATSLIEQQAAAELFKKIVEFDELIESIDPERNPDKALAVLEWIYNNIDKQEYKNRISNISFGIALESLKQHEISTFFSSL